jgi:hypothetical protein
MTKLTKRIVDAIEPDSSRDVFAWDRELRGFGLRVKPSGARTYFIQYRNSEGRTRRLVLGSHACSRPNRLATSLARNSQLSLAARIRRPSGMPLVPV